MSGYIPEETKSKIRRDAENQCGYCRSLQKYVLGVLEIEHIIPKALNGTDEEENLWLACRLCNSYKGIQIEGKDPGTGEVVRLFNPRQQKWEDHFIWKEEGAYIEGITPCGRATTEALQLNNQIAVTVRKAWISAGWHPPIEE